MLNLGLLEIERVLRLPELFLVIGYPLLVRQIGEAKISAIIRAHHVLTAIHIEVLQLVKLLDLLRQVLYYIELEPLSFKLISFLIAVLVLLAV